MGTDNTFGETNFNPTPQWWLDFYMEMPKVIEDARRYAILCHSQTNHRYGDLPYSYHLNAVYMEAIKWLDLVQPEWRNEILAACWTHDLIEDCRQTYNDIKDRCGLTVAEITYALTNEKGKNRAERENYRYFDGIMRTPGAAFVKLCDRLANVKYSIETDSRMLKVYSKEHPFFIRRGWPDELQPMVDELSRIIPDYLTGKTDAN